MSTTSSQVQLMQDAVRILNEELGDIPVTLTSRHMMTLISSAQMVLDFAPLSPDIQTDISQALDAAQGAINESLGKLDSDDLSARQKRADDRLSNLVRFYYGT